MIKFLKKIQGAINNHPKIVFRLSLLVMLFIIIMTFIVQYKNIVLEKKQKHTNEVILKIENEIKLLTSEYVALISPYKLKQLSDAYLPLFKEIEGKDKIRIGEFE